MEDAPIHAYVENHLTFTSVTYRNVFCSIEILLFAFAAYAEFYAMIRNRVPSLNIQKRSFK